MQALDDVMEASVTSAQDDLSRAQWQFTHHNNWGREEGKGLWGACNHTDTTGCHIRSNHDGALASLELVQDPIALILLLVTVNSYRVLATVISRRGSTYRARATRLDEGSG